jgi:hypothetical protein
MLGKTLTPMIDQASLRNARTDRDSKASSQRVFIEGMAFLWFLLCFPHLAWSWLRFGLH